MWNSFERITWSFQNRLRVDVLDRPDRDEGDRLEADHPEDEDEQPPVPLDVAQQGEDEGEGDEEKTGVLQAFREIRRVESLEGVENDDCGQDSGKPDDWELAGGAWRGRGGACGRAQTDVRSRPPLAHATRRRIPTSRRPGSDRCGEHPTRDYEVERDEQVRRVSASVERDSEGERRDDRQRQEDRPAVKGEGEGGRYREGEEGEGGEAGGVVAEVDDLVGVPLVAEDQRRE